MEIDAQQSASNPQPMMLSPNNATVTLPPDEAAKAPYPPSCPVLCFFKDGQFRSGKVNSVKLSISFSTGNRFDTFYEVGFANHNPTMVSGSQLRLLAGCPVFVSSQHFAKRPENVDNWSPGVIIGSFEVPFQNCSPTSQQDQPKQQKFYYSVRALVSGDEIDEHGVDPQNIMYRSRQTKEGAVLRSPARYSPFDHLPIPEKMRLPPSSREDQTPRFFTPRSAAESTEQSNARSSADGKSNKTTTTEEGAGVVHPIPPKITKLESQDGETVSNSEGNVLGIKKHPFRKNVSANNESIAELKEDEKKETPAIVMDEHNEVEEKEKYDVEKSTPTLVTEAVSNNNSPYRKEPLVVLVNEDDNRPTNDNAHNSSEIGIGSRTQPPKTMRTSNVSVTQSSFHNYQPPPRGDVSTANGSTYEKSLQNAQATVETQERSVAQNTLQSYQPTVEEYVVHENTREDTMQSYQPTMDEHAANENAQEDTLQSYQPTVDEHVANEIAREDTLPTYQPAVDKHVANDNTREDELQRYQPAVEEYVANENAQENIPTYKPTVDRHVANENTQEDTLPTYEPTVDKHVPNENTREDTLQSYQPTMDEQGIPLEEYYVHPKQVGYELPKEGLLRSFNIEYPSMEEPPPQRDVSLLRGWGAQEASVDQQPVPTNNHHSNEVKPQMQHLSPQQQESSPVKPESVAPKEDDFRVPTHVVQKDMLNNNVPNSGYYPNQNDVSALTMEPVWRQPRKQLTPMPSSKSRASTKLHQPITEEDRQKIFRERFVRRQQQEDNMQFVGNNIQPTVSAMTEATEYDKQGDLASAGQRMPNTQIGRNSEEVQVSSRNVHEQENDPSQIGTAQQFHDVILNASSQEIVSKGKTHYRKESAPMVVWNADIGQFVSQDGQPLTKEQMAMLTNQLQYAAGSRQQQQGFPPNHHQTREAEENEEVDDTFASPNGKMRTAAHEDDRLPFDTTHDLSPITKKASPAIVKEQKRQQQENKPIAEVESVNGSMMSLLSDIIPTKEGCYLVYGTDTGGKLSLHYSRTAIADAIGFWMPGAGKAIQGFKFSQNCGRVEIIKGIAGGDANKKKYYSGWCQFVKAARAFNGLVCKWPDRAGIEVDLYVFYNETSEVVKIQDGELFDTSKIDAVSCLRKGATVFEGVKKTPKRVFLDKGNSVGRCVDVVS